MQRYVVITTTETTNSQIILDKLHLITVPVGEVVNTVLWDGVTPWNPGEGLRAVLESEYLIAPMR